MIKDEWTTRKAKQSYTKTYYKSPHDQKTNEAAAPALSLLASLAIDVLLKPALAQLLGWVYTNSKGRQVVSNQQQHLQPQQQKASDPFKSHRINSNNTSIDSGSNGIINKTTTAAAYQYSPPRCQYACSSCTDYHGTTIVFVLMKQ